ncbi:hypothetical protein ACQKIE_09820 [Luteibacter sp. NPDC031894]|uniref:hypothetical protein n=1 Tax=Luteibacter sp. NPDC031894 TaxID=3390572 RepID=UPI003D0660BF
MGVGTHFVAPRRFASSIPMPSVNGPIACHGSVGKDAATLEDVFCSAAAFVDVELWEHVQRAPPAIANKTIHAAFCAAGLGWFEPGGLVLSVDFGPAILER